MKYKELGRRLKDIRLAMPGRISQEAFAKSIGLTARNSVAQFEAGVSRPSIETINKICKITGADSAELISLAGYGDIIVGVKGGESVVSKADYEKVKKENMELQKELGELKDQLIKILLKQKK